MKSKKIIVCFIFLLCVIVLFPTAAFAKDNIDASEKVELTIHYRYDGKNISNIPFYIYKIADMSIEDGTITCTDEFKKYPIKLNDLMDPAAWAAYAETLSIYVQRDRDNLQPICSGKTDKDGMLTFSTDDDERIKPGIYLVMSDKTNIDGYKYTTKPFLVCLPGRMEDNTLDYHLTVYPKSSRDKIPSSPSTITRKVLKVWNDVGHENARPSEIVVQLLRDGAVYDTQILTAKTQWRYTWNNLSDEYEWKVAEKSVEKYSTLISQEGITFVVTNSYENDVPDKPDKPDRPNTPDEPGKPNEPNKPNEPKLPQTGTTWYLVPIFACIGTLFLLLGLLRRKTDE